MLVFPNIYVSKDVLQGDTYTLNMFKDSTNGPYMCILTLSDSTEVHITGSKVGGDIVSFKAQKYTNGVKTTEWFAEFHSVDELKTMYRVTDYTVDITEYTDGVPKYLSKYSTDAYLDLFNSLCHLGTLVPHMHCLRYRNEYKKHKCAVCQGIYRCLKAVVNGKLSHVCGHCIILDVTFIGHTMVEISTKDTVYDGAKIQSLTFDIPK